MLVIQTSGGQALEIQLLQMGAALFPRRWCNNTPSLYAGLNQLRKMDTEVFWNVTFSPLDTSRYNICLFSTSSLDSTEAISEGVQLEAISVRIKNSADILGEWGCGEHDIYKIFARRPSLRKTDPEILQSKLEILSKLGITSSDLVKMVHCRPRFLNCRINLFLNERLEYFEAFFGSRQVLAKAIVRNPSLLTYDFHNKIKPVIAIYESLGVSSRDLIAVLMSRPTVIPRTNLNDEKMDYIRKTGVSKESRMYKHVVSLFAISRMATIREKVVNFEKYGFSEDEIFGLIGRSPLLLTLSIDKVQRNMTFILGTIKQPANLVLANPFLLYFNLEIVLKPRYLLACKIEDMGVEPGIKGPAMLRALRMSDKRFVAAFITCHSGDVANELMTFYNNAKFVRRLAESSKKNSNTGFPF
ncbi:transcription termination factor MTERF8, chloroplastic-like isoform X2 [Henckelia pumila]|uniref:transcription termination factor MTERF8, chloroplastic-like isoform X2 n=1 Tax=Henckelia pumila TaxID=405737 RepID=UPI003C6E1DDA